MNTKRDSAASEQAHALDVADTPPRARLFELIGRCTAGIVHDFNNLLTVINGQAELLQLDTSVDDRAKERVSTILTACRRAQSLSINVMEFVKAPASSTSGTDAAAIIAEDLALVRAAAPSSINIERQISSKCPRVSISGIEIHQILMNLCLNAISAMAGTRGTLTVSVAPSAHHDLGGEDGNCVVLCVSDTGNGMDSETRLRIFSPFFSTKSEGDHFGLGLFNVSEIVKNAGGRIEVESEVGVGTSFTVVIPGATGAAPRKESQKPRGFVRVLYVDDEVALVRAQQSALSALGYRVVPKVCPIEADKCFSEHPELFDVVVMDARMPQINGFELTERIRRSRPELPVIMVTGSPEAAERARKHDYGFRACLVKPILPIELDRAIREAVGSV